MAERALCDLILLLVLLWLGGMDQQQRAILGGEGGERADTYLIRRLPVFVANVAGPAPLTDPDFFLASHANTFQNLNVSSAEPDTTIPSGDTAVCNTREVCPFNSFMRAIVGYFQRHN
jgi:hypothetical protein